jgi:hypothetical protein
MTLTWTNTVTSITSSMTLTWNPGALTWTAHVVDGGRTMDVLIQCTSSILFARVSNFGGGACVFSGGGGVCLIQFALTCSPFHLHMKAFLAGNPCNCTGLWANDIIIDQ